jgi:hypothetical protein
MRTKRLSIFFERAARLRLWLFRIGSSERFDNLRQRSAAHYRSGEFLFMEESSLRPNFS